MRRVAIAVLGTVVTSACASVLGFERATLDTDDAAAGAPDANGSDGSAVDASDASARDGGSPCKESHTFCADFDSVGDENPLESGWTYLQADPPTTVTLDETFGLSAPRSMHAMTQRLTSGTPRYSILSRKLGTTWQRAVFQADFFLATPDWQGSDVNVVVMELLYQDGTVPKDGVFLFLSKSSTSAAIQSVTDDSMRYLQADPLPSGRWVHLLVDFDPAGALSYEIDGARVGPKAFAKIAQPPSANFKVDVGVVNYNAPAPAIDIHWDNVVVDLK